MRYRYSAVMARQVMEDALSFFYLSEPNLMHEEKQFREDVWRFHGATESIESVRCANVSNPDLAPAIDAELKRRKELLEKHPRLSAIEGGRRGRIRQGRENHVLHDREILERRGIQTEVYDLGRKVLSNFAHFSTLSHQLIRETGGEWEKSWQTFLHPSLYVANFAAETIEAFLETFTQTQQLLSRDEQAVVANFRSTLRTPFEPRIVRN